MRDFLLIKHNPWWEKISKIKEDIVVREFNNQYLKYYHPFLKSLPSKDGVVVVRGPRRIGKTTLMKLSIRKLLLSKRIKPKNVFFYPCDRIKDFNELYDLLMNYFGRSNIGRRYIFLDEITFVTEWQRAIKDLWDGGDLKNCTLILTGSNALDLKISSERLPGRRGRISSKDVEYLPLKFADFMRLTGKNKSVFKLFQDYLLCGGFPQAINEYYQKGFIANFLYETYLSWIEGDIQKIGKSEKYMYAVAGEIFKHLGSTASWYKIAKNTGIGSHSTVSDYTDIFEKLFISFALNFYAIEEKKIYLNKNKKLYFLDPIIIHSLKGKLDNFTDKFFEYSKETKNSSLLPSFIENIVGIYLRQFPGELFYGHFQDREVDFVLRSKKKEYFFEVKYQENIKISDFSFWQKKKPLIVITRNFNLKKNNLLFIALEKFLLKTNIL